MELHLRETPNKVTGQGAVRGIGPAKFEANGKGVRPFLHWRQAPCVSGVARRGQTVERRPRSLSVCLSPPSPSSITCASNHSPLTLPSTTVHRTHSDARDWCGGGDWRCGPFACGCQQRKRNRRRSGEGEGRSLAISPRSQPLHCCSSSWVTDDPRSLSVGPWSLLPCAQCL